jgi:predicted homoserine dehydrogenase-like protein
MYKLLKRDDKKIRIALIGIGTMGKALFYQCHISPAFDCVAIADLKIERAIEAAKWLGKDFRVVASTIEAEDVISQGKIAISDDGALIAACHNYDCLVESSSSIKEAAHFSEIAIRNGKHLILMNSEIDLIFGPYLMKLAERNNVVFTSCDGDQHTVLKRMMNDIQLWGFDIIMAGNIKGFLDKYSNPTKIIPEADKRNLDYKMATAFTDGTKLNIEMALVANGTGLRAVKPGMTGHYAKTVHEVFELFDFEEIWKSGSGSVDYIIGAEPGGGVYLIGRHENEYQQYMMNYYKMGQGPYYLFYRPYHLCHVESLLCVAEAFYAKEPLLMPEYGFVTNVYTYAKKDLKAGEILDGIGGYLTYGMIENLTDNELSPGLPICLAEGVKLKRDIHKDGKICLSDLEYDPGTYEFKLFDKSLEASATCRK